MLYLWLGISTLFNFITSFVVGLMVYAKDPHNKINKTFAIFCFFMGGWSAGYFFPFTPESEELSYLSFQLLHAFAIFIAIAHFHFVCAVLNIIHKQKILIIGGYIFNLIILGFVPTEYFIADMVPKYDFTYWAVTGIVYDIWLFIWLSYIAYSVYLLAIHWKKNTGVKRYQIKYILYGDVLTFAFGSTNFFLFYNINFPPYFDIVSSAQILIIFYLILHSRFLNIKLNISQSAKKIFSFLSSICAAFTIHFLVTYFFNFTPSFYFYIPLALVVIITYTQALKYLNHPKFYKYLDFSNIEYYSQIIQNFKNQNRFYISLEELEIDIDNTFCKQLGIEKIELIPIQIKGNKKKYKDILDYFTSEKEILVTKELMYQEEGKKENKELIKQMKKIGEVCLPLYQSKGNIIGLLILGKKPFDDIYSTADIRLIESTAHYIALSLTGIIYNYSLQKEVKEKTRELVKKNTEIQKLVQQQADFISVTSHEFRTPLSITEFQLENILEEYDHSPEVREELTDLKKSLSNVRDLTQKLFQVQQHDLNKIEFRPERTSIHTFMEEIHHSFALVAKEKEIDFRYKNFIPKSEGEICLDIDVPQFRQIVHNLLNNAYKFSEHGKRIVLSLRKEKKNILIGVYNDGESISDADKKRIFDKFQTKEAKLGTGIGLGLYICKKVIDLHGGKIWIENGRKEGTIFFISIPIPKEK